MKKRNLILLLVPFLLLGCVENNGKNSQKSNNNSSGGDISSPGGEGSNPPGSISNIEDKDAYDHWLNSWSKPGHLYFHYNRGDKGGYNDYCLWLWQHSPQDLEGSLWAFSANPKVSDKLTLSPMSTHWMTAAEVGKEGDATYLDEYGVIADVDLYNANLKGGKTGTATTFEGMEEVGFLLPRVN